MEPGDRVSPRAIGFAFGGAAEMGPRHVRRTTPHRRRAGALTNLSARQVPTAVIAGGSAFAAALTWLNKIVA
jgi:hypothetical protein